MKTTQTTHTVAFTEGAILTIGAGTYKLSLVSTWQALNGAVRTTGRVNFHNARTGHGWGGEMSKEQWEALQVKGVL